LIHGNYVKKFSDANYAMPQGISLDAPYAYHWLTVVSSDERTATCIGGGEDKQVLLIRRDKKKRSEYVVVTIPDPIFGPQKFKAYPFKGDSSR